MSIWEQLPSEIQSVAHWITDRPLALLALMVTPLLLVAWLRRAYPHTPLLLLAFVPAGLSVALLRWPEVQAVVLIADALIVLVALYDLTTTVGRRKFSASRETGRIASLRKNHSVTLAISNQSKRRFRVGIRDDLPEEFSAQPQEFTIQLQPRSRTILRYQFKASRRGAYSMETVYVRVRSRLGLWQTYLKLPVESTVHVYPDLQQLGEYAVLARTNRLSLMGVKRTRKIGQDNEFERLRDYTQDDNYKHIDWRSTARRNKLTVRDFQTNQSQRIIFLVDCGRMMVNESDGLSLLDHSLNAMLMMSYVALRQGDSVGLICFSNQVHRFVPPRGGMKQMNQLLYAVFDQHASLVESRYDQAFLYLASHCHKRSLVVLISNVIDEVNSLQVHQYLASLTGRHLPLGILLRDQQIFRAVDHPAQTFEQVFQAGAAAEILTWRHQVLHDLERQGVLALDVFPEDMTAPLVNKYLEIKARHLL